MSTVRWNIAVSPDMDHAVRMFITAQGGGRKGDLSRVARIPFRTGGVDRATRRTAPCEPPFQAQGHPAAAPRCNDAQQHAASHRARRLAAAAGRVSSRLPRFASRRGIDPASRHPPQAPPGRCRSAVLSRHRVMGGADGRTVVSVRPEAPGTHSDAFRRATARRQRPGGCCRSGSGCRRPARSCSRWRGRARPVPRCTT